MSLAHPLHASRSLSESDPLVRTVLLNWPGATPEQCADVIARARERYTRSGGWPTLALFVADEAGEQRMQAERGPVDRADRPQDS